MDINVLNEKLERFAIIRKYKSLTWNTYYNSQGSFTLVCSLNTLKKIGLGAKERFIEIPADKNHVGIIENIDKKTEDSTGEKVLTLKGRMVESLFDRRVQLKNDEYKNKPAVKIIEDILQQNFISPDDECRKMELITFVPEMQPILSNIDYELLRGFDCESIIRDIASLIGVGLSVNLTKDYKKFQVMLYKGLDRTLNQQINKRVVIRQKQGTVIDISYYKDTTKHKTWAAIDKEFDVPTSYPLNTEEGLSGLKRKETYFDLSSMSQTIVKADGTEIVIEDVYYENMIQNEAKTRLNKLVITEALDSVVPKNVAKKFRSEIYLGDIVTVQDEETGLQTDSRITGATEVWSENGYELVLQIGEDASNYNTNIVI